MATGRLGTASITTTVNTSVYTVPASTFAVVSVNIANRNAANAVVRLALTLTGTPSNDEFIEFDSVLVGNGVLERTGIVLDAGKQIVVSTTTGSPALSVVVYGIETSTT
jgi:hypothetical protein